MNNNSIKILYTPAHQSKQRWPTCEIQSKQGELDTRPHDQFWSCIYLPHIRDLLTASPPLPNSTASWSSPNLVRLTSPALWSSWITELVVYSWVLSSAWFSVLLTVLSYDNTVQSEAMDISINYTGDWPNQIVALVSSYKYWALFLIHCCITLQSTCSGQKI